MVEHWVVAPVAHGYAERPVNFGAARRRNGQGDKSIGRADTNLVADVFFKDALNRLRDVEHSWFHGGTVNLFRYSLNRKRFIS